MKSISFSVVLATLGVLNTSCGPRAFTIADQPDDTPEQIKKKNKFYAAQEYNTNMLGDYLDAAEFRATYGDSRENLDRQIKDEKAKKIADEEAKKKKALLKNNLNNMPKQFTPPAAGGRGC